jgi:hypothetical protein
MSATREQVDFAARRFNETFTYRWERVIDFLKLHYVLSRREDHDYWRDNRRSETVPERLSALLALWHNRPPSRYDINRIQEVFPAASYQYVLYGMGFQTEPGLARRLDDGPLADGFLREAAGLTRRMLAALPDNRSLIDHIRRHGLPRI